ncbi:putative PMR5 domain, trichome birefringence-like family [Helianthus anomalus]
MDGRIGGRCWCAIILFALVLGPKAYACDECDLYQGSWVYDESYRLYDSLECPHIRMEFDCIKYDREI